MFRLKKLCMDCQLASDQIQPFIVNEETYPAVQNLPMISERTIDTVVGERAVIIGGSISGLLTASCLAPFFKEVVIVERTKYNEGESVVKHRHGYLPHILVNRGQVILEKLFPGIIQYIRKKSIELDGYSTKEGEIEFVIKNYIDSTRDLKIIYGTGQENGPALAQASTKESSVEDVTIVSRGMWETSIREFILKGMKNLRVMDGYQVVSNGKGITYSVDKNGSSADIKVNGVIVQPSNDEDNSSVLNQNNNFETIPCDLLVNCGSFQTSTEYSKLLRGLECAMLDLPLQKQVESIPTNHHLLSSSRINNKVRYHCFYFEPKQEAFDYYNKPHDSLPFVLGKDGKKRIVQSPLTVARSSYDPSHNGSETEFLAFYYLLIYPFTKGALCIPLEKNLFMINLITIADEEKKNNQEFCDGLTLENAKERIINIYAKGTPFEKDLIHLLGQMKDVPLSIPPIFEKEGSIFVHYEKFMKHHVAHSNGNDNTNQITETRLSGFISLGDSVASLNPVYAQGLTMALESVLILREQLKERYHSLRKSKVSNFFDNEFCLNFQNSLYFMYTIPWIMSSSDDIRYTDIQLNMEKKQNSWLDTSSPFSTCMMVIVLNDIFYLISYCNVLDQQ
ncbi:predicted protein [Naegleria gruberi]|uniref:Predicted protein n=1 Tax=Naegleria gruberi TaxID=5762 RepID=D2W0S5_NAEGR|nr:uncharacterized protein NAEGRDRAFT_74963 [Naegleria gruberi]EFC37386.1 predicted protein [Naegleria gruberi]|eukprot:XP_002670130.1 predicted protein [Naegleria gruberi strain NEG-M]